MTNVGVTGTVQRKSKESVMRAAVIEAPGRVRVDEIFVREPAADEVLVRIQGCGVCASNLEIWSGQPWFEYPLSPGAPGHEAWGIIDKVGERVNNIQAGERVAMLSNNAYAEFDLAKEDAVIRIPDFLQDQDVPAEPLGCAMNIFSRSHIKPGENVAIVGIGFLGALLTQIASKIGANVIAIARRPFALQTASMMGAAHVIQITDQQAAARQVADLTDGKGCEVVIEATGKQQPLDLATELTCERGRLVIAGYHQDGSRQVNMQLWNWRGLDVINAHERDSKVYIDGMCRAITAVADGTITPSALYTHTFGLDELGKALEMTKTRPGGFMKALIKL
jgi:threonine dehydrogenase-like Zn-dependent dehydrogenase